MNHPRESIFSAVAGKHDAYIASINASLPPDIPGKKYDAGKPDYTLLPFKALEEVVAVLGFGAIKYGRDNWRGVAKLRYIAAAFRHLVAIASGSEIDEESGKSHAAHLACCALFLSELRNK
jgi:hypothetical protein